EGDEALRAARLALEVVDRAPGARLALATSRVASHDGAPDDAAIERGAAGLERARGLPVLDDDTARLVEGHLAIERDRDQGVVGRIAARVSLPPPVMGHATPTVGRDVELKTLALELEACVDDARPRAVLVTAQPGMGKTRLQQEFAQRVRDDGLAEAWTAHG